MISLIQCFKAINNFLVWKDPDSRESEDRNIVARALHIKDQAENNKKKTIIKILKAQSPQFFSTHLLKCHENLKALWFYW